MSVQEDTKQISCQSIGECWLGCIKHVLDVGAVHYDEDVSIKEVLGLSVKIKKPKATDIIVERCGNEAVTNNMLKKFSQGIKMENRPFTYGQRIYDYKGINQFEWVVDRVKKKRETKSAAISLLYPGESLQNLPCLTTLDFKVRNNKLFLQFFFRSQNILGRQYANLIALADLQSRLAKHCEAEVGEMQGYIASAHIYEYDFDSAKNLVSGKMEKIEDKFYHEGPSSIRNNVMFTSDKK